MQLEILVTRSSKTNQSSCKLPALTLQPGESVAIPLQGAALTTCASPTTAMARTVAGDEADGRFPALSEIPASTTWRLWGSL